MRALGARAGGDPGAAAVVGDEGGQRGPGRAGPGAGGGGGEGEGEDYLELTLGAVTEPVPTSGVEPSGTT